MSAYYNENDPKAAAWLRELIRAGLIAPGEVDERDIRDVCADELRGFTQHHFFAGIGVWSYALRSAGWEDDRSVWTGSCPCQPFSAAGGRAGFADERHLWPSWFWLIEAFGPRTVFGEQVASKDGLAWLDVVQADMEGAGYAFGALDLCAAGFGAPHIRQRTFFVADATSARRVGQIGGAEGQARVEARLRVSGESGIPKLADANVEVQSGRRVHGPGEGVGESAGSALERSAGLCATDALAVTDSRQRSRLADGEGCERGGQAAGRIESDGELESSCVVDGMGDAERISARRNARAGDEAQRGIALWSERDDAGSSGADGRLGDTESRNGGLSVRQKQRADLESVGASAAGPAAFATGPTNGIWRAADWLLCRDGKWRPVSPGTFPLVDGSAARVGRLRGYGNAIVAPVAQAFIEAAMSEIDGASLTAE